MRDLYISSEGTHPITIEEIKTYCLYLGDDPGIQSTLENISIAARLRLEDFCGRNLCEKTMVLLLNKVDYRQELPNGPINAITSVTVYDDENTLDETLTADTDYFLLGDFHKYIRFATIPSGEYIKITYTSGYKTGGQVLPQALKRAILAQTKYDWRNSSGGGESGQAMLSNEARMLVAPFREYEI